MGYFFIKNLEFFAFVEFAKIENFSKYLRKKLNLA